MGTVLSESLYDSKEIDLELFKQKFNNEYNFKIVLRQYKFITLLVTSKKYITDCPFIIKLFPFEAEKYHKYSQKLAEINNLYNDIKLSPNIVPIIEIGQIQEANAGYIKRQYIQYNLRQALYYLSCVSEIEKKWICFQLLLGLNQIHSKVKCHGDIKPENILITSKLSVFYSDISVYKPVYLIIEKLQLYNSFFYCNSENRACYLAPERFVHNLNNIDKNNLNELTKEMDIFSLGIVFAEIFLDKTNFLSQNDLINYKNIDLEKKLKDIKDIKLKEVIKNMIKLEPKKRIKLSDLIQIFSDDLCPPPFTRFICHLNLMIISYGYYQNDILVALLYKHFIQIWKSLCINNPLLKQNEKEIPILQKKLNKNLVLNILSNKHNIYSITNKLPLAFIKKNANNNNIFFEDNINKDFFITNEDDDFNNSENDCTILIVKYLISCLDNLKYLSTFYVIFEMIFYLSKILCKNQNQNVIIDLIIPYYINLFKINNTKLNIETYNSLLDILNLINYDDLILNQIDYNSFNFYIFENIYKLFLFTNKIEIKCAIISRLDEIIELENKFLFAYLNTVNNIILNQKNKDKNELKKSQYQQDLVFKTFLGKKAEKNNLNDNIDFNYVYNNYQKDYNNFKKKLKEIVKNIIEENNDTNNDSLILLLIYKYKNICLFCGNYNENKPLLNYLFILFNRKNFFIQKEIIKMFPSLVLLFGKKLFYEYFLLFIEPSFQNKNSELIIIEIVDAIILLSKMNLINFNQDFSKSYQVLKCYKMLIPYLIHPNHLLRNKLKSLFNDIISQDNALNVLYISFYHKIKNILKENNKSIAVINIINQELINKIIEYYYIPREIFLLYKYNIECDLFNIEYINYIYFLEKITKIKKNHYINKVKEDINLRNNLGLINKQDIFNLPKKNFSDIAINEYKKFLNKNRVDNNSEFINNFVDKITIILSEITQKKKGEKFKNKNFLSKFFIICGTKENVIHSEIIYIIKLLNFKIDLKNILNSILTPKEKNINEAIIDKDCEDWNVLNNIESSKFKSINVNYLNFIKEKKNPKFCFELYLNLTESIIKLIPINSYFTNISQNYFISISNEGIIRLHLIYSEPNLEKIYTIKNKAQYKIELGNFNLNKKHICYIEKNNKIIVVLIINKKIEIVNFELNNDNDKTEDLNESLMCNYNQSESSKEMICVEDYVKNDKNYIVLGNSDNTISFFNYIDNSIDHINNSSFFSSSYGNIDIILSLINSNDILISTSYGYIIFYDYNLRSFIYAYSFNISRNITQIIEYIPKDNSDLIFFEHKNKKLENYIYILTNDIKKDEKSNLNILEKQITLWNLSLSSPIIIYDLIKVNNIDNYEKKKNKKKKNSPIPKMEKISLRKNFQNYAKIDYNFIRKNELNKINVNFIWNINFSSNEIITGEKNGICRAINFCCDNLKKIKNKQGHKNNKFTQIIFYEKEKYVLSTRNNSKYIKDKNVFYNKLIYSLNEKFNENIDDKEMNDVIVIKDCYYNYNMEFVIAGYSNGTIKLWII